MDRLTDGAAVAAVLVSLTLSLAACGGGSSGGTSETGAVADSPAGPAAQSIDGITTPASVSVVTAKNAN